MRKIDGFMLSGYVGIFGVTAVAMAVTLAMTLTGNHVYAEAFADDDGAFGNVSDIVMARGEEPAVAVSGDEAGADESFPPAEEAVEPYDDEYTAYDEPYESYDSWYDSGYAGYGYVPSDGLTVDGGVNYHDGRVETYYSSNVLYHEDTADWELDEDRFYRDSDGYYVVAASDMEQGTVFEGSMGECKVYDTGCAAGVTDYYCAW